MVLSAWFSACPCSSLASTWTLTVFGAGPEARKSLSPRARPAALTTWTTSEPPRERRWRSMTGSWRLPSGLWTTVHPVTFSSGKMSCICQTTWASCGGATDLPP